MLLREVEDPEGDYTNVCGVTRDAMVAEAWDAGHKHFVKHVPIGLLAPAGYDSHEF